MNGSAFTLYHGFRIFEIIYSECPKYVFVLLLARVCVTYEDKFLLLISITFNLFRIDYVADVVCEHFIGCMFMFVCVLIPYLPTTIGLRQ